MKMTIVRISNTLTEIDIPTETWETRQQTLDRIKEAVRFGLPDGSGVYFIPPAIVTEG